MLSTLAYFAYLLVFNFVRIKLRPTTTFYYEITQINYGYHLQNQILAL